MHKRLSTIWLALFLLPYLCFAVIGDLPHMHGRHGGFVPTSHAVFASEALTGSAMVLDLGSDENDPAHCSICQVQAAFSACASTIISPCTVPIIASPVIANAQYLTARSILTLSASRAPPTSLS